MENLHENIRINFSWKRILKELLIWSLALLVGMLILFLLNDHIPELNFSPKLELNGLFIGGWMIFCLIRFQKRIFQSVNSYQMIIPTALGGLVVLIVEIIYQIILQVTFVNSSFWERTEIMLKNLSLMTIFGVIISFFVVFQLRTRNTKKLFLMILSFFVIFYFVNKLIQF